MLQVRVDPGIFFNVLAKELLIFFVIDPQLGLELVINLPILVDLNQCPDP